MNEKLQYASMLEIPVNTCNVTLTPVKKGRKKRKKAVDSESIKQELIEKINEKSENMQVPVQPSKEMDELVDEQVEEQEITASVGKKESSKRARGFSIIGAQVAVIGILIATIFLTNALYVDSGINVFLREVFKVEQTATVDDREYDDFTPVLSMDGAEVSLADGIMSFTGKGSVYSPCDGVVSSITQTEDGKYTMEITHSTNFKSVISGIDYAYAGLEQKVYGNIPVGYVTAGVTACFKNQDDVVISDYQIVDGSVVWAV